MAPTSEELRRLELRREELKAQIVGLGNLRPGSLVGRFRKCGKDNCHCAREQDGGHGPSWSLTHHVGGKTVTTIIPSGPAVERTQRQLAEHQRFRSLIRELIAVSERLCNAQLAAPAHAAASAESAKKKGSKRRSRLKSAGRSRRS